MTATDRYNRFKIIVKKDGLSQIADSYYWQRLIIGPTRRVRVRPRIQIGAILSLGQSAECLVFVCIEGGHTFRRYDYLHASSYFE